MRSKTRPVLLASLAAMTVLSLTAAIAIFLGGRMSSDDVSTTSLPIGEAPEALRLTVTETGIAAVSLSEVREAGLPVDSLSPETLGLSRDGQPIPFHVLGEGAGAVLLFYGEAVTATMEAPAVYWLAPGEGQAMPRERVRQAGDLKPVLGYELSLWEQNKVFLAQSEGSDLWLGQLIFPPSSLDVPLDGIRPSGGPAALTVRIWSNNQAPANPDHHVEISLNGRLLVDHYWDGIAEETLNADVPSGLLREAGNLLTIEGPGDTGAAGEQLYLDWIQLSYESKLDASQRQVLFTSEPGRVTISGIDREGLLLDVTDARRPVVLEGYQLGHQSLWFESAGIETRYAAANLDRVYSPAIGQVPQRESLRAPGRGANYVAIVADVDGFNEALEPLLAYRASQGLSVVSVPLSQLYDEFSYGRESGHAIQKFLLYTREQWSPAPHFVLLVGDATYDVNDYTAGKNRNLLPTHLVDTRFAGYVASDTWYTLLADDTMSPSLAIGRFPAQTAQHVTAMVEKTITYENGANSAWVGRALLVADDEVAFDEASDRLADQLSNAGIVSQRLYMTQNDDAEYNRDAIFGALNQGVGIVNYVGHGSIEVWGDEKVLSAGDAGTLANRERLPIFTTFTCLNGFFNHPQVDALAETLLWAADGGVVAAIAPSGRTTTNQQTPLADEFYGALLSGQAITLGEALQQAKIAAAGNENLRDVIHTFNLLGDPALQFQTPTVDPGE